MMTSKYIFIYIDVERRRDSKTDGYKQTESRTEKGETRKKLRNMLEDRVVDIKGSN
jgi:hypothetical protein